MNDDPFYVLPFVDLSKSASGQEGHSTVSAIDNTRSKKCVQRSDIHLSAKATQIIRYVFDAFGTDFATLAKWRARCGRAANPAGRLTRLSGNQNAGPPPGVVEAYFSLAVTFATRTKLLSKNRRLDKILGQRKAAWHVPDGSRGKREIT
ncbi:MAG: hypothetical protein ABJG86_04180 [Nitratireductor sp.]